MTPESETVLSASPQQQSSAQESLDAKHWRVHCEYVLGAADLLPLAPTEPLTPDGFKQLMQDYIGRVRSDRSVRSQCEAVGWTPEQLDQVTQTFLTCLLKMAESNSELVVDVFETPHRTISAETFERFCQLMETVSDAISSARTTAITVRPVG